MFQLIKPSSGYREYPNDNSLQQEAIHGKIHNGMYVMLQKNPTELQHKLTK
jgi:hypothetical protein